MTTPTIFRCNKARYTVESPVISSSSITPSLVQSKYKGKWGNNIVIGTLMKAQVGKLDDDTR